MERVGLPNRASYRSCHRRRRDRIPLLTAVRLLGVFTRTPLIGNPLAIFTDALPNRQGNASSGAGDQNIVDFQSCGVNLT